MSCTWTPWLAWGSPRQEESDTATGRCWRRQAYQGRKLFSWAHSLTFPMILQLNLNGSSASRDAAWMLTAGFYFQCLAPIC